LSPELPPSESEGRPEVSLEQRVLALETQLKALQDIVREHFAAPDHRTNPEPLRELQESASKISAIDG
jgi:hypothetical protein